MQLRNASVDSLADGVLTLSFAQTGFAKGFLTGGYDKVLSEVLAEMFGASPAITTSVGAPVSTAPDLQTGTGPSDSPPAAQRARTRRAADHESDTSASADGPTGASSRGNAGAPQRGNARAIAGRPPAARAADEPGSGDLPAPDALTGTDLIERELGGRIIEELGGP
jgi:hypothetical protein